MSPGQGSVVTRRRPVLNAQVNQTRAPTLAALADAHGGGDRSDQKVTLRHFSAPAALTGTQYTHRWSTDNS